MNTTRKSKFTGKTYEIVFEDQFDGGTLKDHWTTRDTNYNNSEANSYQNEKNIKFADGKMILRGARETEEYECGAFWGEKRKTTLTFRKSTLLKPTWSEKSTIMPLMRHLQ